MHYLSSEDLLSRLKLFGTSILFAVLYLMLIALNPPDKEKKILLAESYKSAEKLNGGLTGCPAD